ncbi:hypothetical protein EAG_10196 [Camponotus floridanus]|uniref:Uncharacterized protein n=1 Tax=Camponotus floridanus TaxID=104421 RepID=E1ZVL8_CAMFO|nr:hypothetical protein EAG_10196 [Camponotus floridanus]
MSQDVTTSKSTENLSMSYYRSKSRSVDHGFTAPFDLDSLRNKVEGRFESVDKLAKEKIRASNDPRQIRYGSSGQISELERLTMMVLDQTKVGNPGCFEPLLQPYSGELH